MYSSWENNGPPPTPGLMPTSPGDPAIMISKCGVWPGFVVVMSTENGENTSRRHDTTCCQVASLAENGVSVRVWSIGRVPW